MEVITSEKKGSLPDYVFLSTTERLADHFFVTHTLFHHMDFQTGDLFIDGKVVHRPQYRFNERQQTRNRPRPRYDRRREIMQVERRDSIRQPPTSVNNQNVAQGGSTGGYQANQGGYKESSA